MSPRIFTLPDSFSAAIATNLSTIGYRIESPAPLAEAVLRLSDHYANSPSSRTPWHEPWAQAAYLAYYFPLNHARARAVALEGKRLGFFQGLTDLVDFGSGPGSALLAFAESMELVDPRRITAVDVSTDALRMGKALAGQIQNPCLPTDWRSLCDSKPFAAKEKNSLLLASYVWTELQHQPEWWKSYNALAIIEPSTREDGRNLSALRQTLMAENFTLWAPCTHQGACPMLVHSERDWCHDRIHWQPPAWFEALERRLPIKNRTLTFSYLLARKTAAPGRLKGLARLTGDQLEEKGKTRISFCRSPEREFLAWFPERLRKAKRQDLATLDLHRGSLLRASGTFAQKNNEIRLTEDSNLEGLKADEDVSDKG